MASDEITKEIGALVDHLRAGDDQKISLTEIASATEVLLQATRMYFQNIDTSIFKQVQLMTDLISAMRLDIAQLSPEDLKDDHIPRAGLELDAIVQNTEDATNTIMEAAEEIMSVDMSDPDDAKKMIGDSCMRIFEACSFQDITGQRVNKVVKTLAYIESGLESLRDDWAEDLGLESGEVKVKKFGADSRPDAHLLHGPPLSGEGVNQDEVDALMNNDAAGPSADEAETPVAKETEAPEKPEAPKKPEAVTKSAPKEKPKPKAEAKPEPKAAEKPKVEKVAKDPEPATDDDEGETASQTDIDALFD